MSKKQTNILEIDEQKFEFDSPIKTKYIEEWDSLIFNLVLLKNGDVYTIVKKGLFGDYEMGRNIDENCKFLDLVKDPNYTTPIFKTNNHLHYFVRYNESIDNDEIDINLYHKKIPLTEELKSNKLVPYYVSKKYDKKNELYNFKYLLTKIIYDEETNDTKLDGLGDDYFLYDYKKKIMYVDVDGLTLNIQLDDSSFGGETKLLRCFQSKKVIGYEKFIYKKNANYIIFKSNNKKFVSVFTNPKWSYKDGNSDDNLFEINEEFLFGGNYEKNFSRGDSYFKNDFKNVKNDYKSKGQNVFNDKFLPHYIDIVDSGDSLVFGYLDTQQKFVIPKDSYDAVKKLSFKKL